MNTLTEEQRRQSRRNATVSECFGTIATTILDDSALIILFVTMLGFGNTFSLLTTASRSLMGCFLLIPTAWFAVYYGSMRAMRHSTLVSVLAFLLLAAAPWFGSLAKTVVVIGIVLYCLTMQVYNVSWFSIIDGFLRPEDRAPFLGLNRFCWQVTCFCFIFLAGLTLGTHPALWQVQLVLAIAGLCSLGRWYFIGRTYRDPALIQDTVEFRQAFHKSLTNTPLCGFSIYLFALYLAAYSTVPVCYLYLQNVFCVGKSLLVIISSFSLLGMLAGYLIAGKAARKYGTKKLLLIVHFAFGILNLCLFFCTPKGGMSGVAVIAGILLLYGFFTAVSGVICSSEIMALARPGNKAMAIAFGNSFDAAGKGLSRLASSFLIGWGILAPEWTFRSAQVTCYQSLFLIAGASVIVVCLLLILVPAIFPEHDYYYEPR